MWSFQTTTRIILAVKFELPDQNKENRLPATIDPRLKEIHDQIVKETGSERGFETWYISNCAEFNAVNKALLDGVNPENIMVHTVNTHDQEPKPACKNCARWLEKLGVKLILD